ncbi:MAG: hypothetical protein IPK82_36605 [Polyangiaceae bacterium]|nr:hypothetical protein [Polyangiaceae bacterium]
MWKRWLAAAVICAGCGVESPSTVGPGDAPSQDEVIVSQLRTFDAERRRGVDMAAAPPSNGLFGADPYVLKPASHNRWVGLLRGARALVLLDSDFREIARAEGIGAASGVAVSEDTAFAVGEGSPRVHIYALRDRAIEPIGSVAVGALGMRDIAAGPGGVLHVADEIGGSLISLVPESTSAEAPRKAGEKGDVSKSYSPSSAPVGAGTFRVVTTETAVAAVSLIEHRVRVFHLDAMGKPESVHAVSIENDGPFWALSAVDAPGATWIVTGGTENKRLDRTHGSFENIDSFVYIDRVEWGSPPIVSRVAAINVSEQGVLTPKAIAAEIRGENMHLFVTGYGGENAAAIDIPMAGGKPKIETIAWPPGSASIVQVAPDVYACANPLLDAWVLGPPPGRLVSVSGEADSKRSIESRIGEALIFTSLMAPWNRSDGPLSRFTCETCHFEGYVDGRTHSTGRGDVRATTKPLFGLWNNRPHFTRALDPDLAAVAHAEFRVAGARSDHSPIFDLHVADRGWLSHLGAADKHLDALSLRRAFMVFLSEFTHRSSPFVEDRNAFDSQERVGAALFRDRCETCHEARTVSDDPASRVPFQQWEALILSSKGPIVWAQAKYFKTGVEPYVHEEGARVSSLRRLHKKGPYFTNGSAKTLDDVLRAARFGADIFVHSAAHESVATGSFSADEREALKAFLSLL